jgi:putative peptide zinc metalloprotease protein
MNPESTFEFFDLYIGREGEDYIVGRQDIGVYINLPEPGVEALNLLRKGTSLKEAESLLSNKYGEEITLKGLVEDFIDAGFIKSVDGTDLEQAHEVKEYHFTWIKKSHVSWLFSRVAVTVQILFIVSGLSLLFFKGYTPEYSDLFFYPWYTVVGGVTFVCAWLLAFKHEFYHLLAAKNYGVEGRFSFSHRLYFVVAETDLTNVWSLPKKQRYVIYFAGLLTDFIFMAACFWVRFLADSGVVDLGAFGYDLVKALTLMQLTQILWQFLFFMRTDIYYVFVTLFQATDLLADTQRYIKENLHQYFNVFSKQDLGFISERELEVIKYYSIFYLVGSCITMGVFLFYLLPIAGEFLVGSLEGILHGPLAKRTDGLVFVSVLAVYIILMVRALWRRE